MKVVISCAALLVASSAWAESPDSSFYKNAAEANMAEIALGQEAQQKATDPAVKDFGALMIQDHTAANDKLKTLADSKQVTLPDSPSEMQKAAKAAVDMHSGDGFDHAFVKQMIKDHKKAIKAFQTEANSGQDTDARGFATATLPTLRAHLSKIEAIASAEGVKHS